MTSTPRLPKLTSRGMHGSQYTRLEPIDSASPSIFVSAPKGFGAGFALRGSSRLRSMRPSRPTSRVAPRAASLPVEPSPRTMADQRASHHSKHSAISLGVVRLDYNYEAQPGDIDCPDTFGYDVYYHVEPGFTFEMCMSGHMTPAVERQFVKAINFLRDRGVTGITGDCALALAYSSGRRKCIFRHTTYISTICARSASSSAAFTHKGRHAPHCMHICT